MPTYTFLNLESGMEYDETMPMSEYDEYMRKNNVQRIYQPIALSADHLMGVGPKNDSGFNDVMGKIADAVIASDGHATGIIPKFLDNVEIAHRGLNNLHVIDTMHERKNMMYDIADGFIIMPGGLGTLDETMEIITWRQLGLHRKPIIVANLYGYWDHMLLLFQNIIDEGFMHHGHTGHFDHVNDIDELADKLDSYFPASQRTDSQK